MEAYTSVSRRNHKGLQVFFAIQSLKRIHLQFLSCLRCRKYTKIYREIEAIFLQISGWVVVSETSKNQLLKATRRWYVPVTSYTHELTQAKASNIPSKRRNDVLGIDRVDHPELTFFRYRLDIRCPN